MQSLLIAELEIELKDLRSQRADMFEKYEVEKSEASQLNEIQEEIDRCVCARVCVCVSFCVRMTPKQTGVGAGYVTQDGVPSGLIILLSALSAEPFVQRGLEGLSIGFVVPVHHV